MMNFYSIEENGTLYCKIRKGIQMMNQEKEALIKKSFLEIFNSFETNEKKFLTNLIFKVKTDNTTEKYNFNSTEIETIFGKELSYEEIKYLGINLSEKPIKLGLNSYLSLLRFDYIGQENLIKVSLDSEIKNCMFQLEVIYS